MADPLDLSPIVRPASVTPQEALEFFRSKGFAPPDARFSYRDWWGASHARGFVVAKAMKDDLLRTLRNGVEKAIAEGWTMERFRKEIEPELKRQGWWGQKTMTDPLTGRTSTVQLGSARRLRVILDTNMRTAHAAGRWMRIQRTKADFPYLQYVQLQRVTARDAHKPFHGLVIPVDHPWWNTHFPPNGYFCACTVRQLSEDAVKRRGLKVTQNPPMETRTWTDRRSGRTAQVPKGVTPGFDVNPGAEFLAAEANHDRIAEGLDPLARGVERGLIQEARLRGLRTGNEHLGAIDLEAPLPGTDGGRGEAFDWVEGERDGVSFSPAIDEAVSDGNRRIGLVHNHPRSSSLSSDDIAALGAKRGLVRVVAVGHDGSLYMAAMPRVPKIGMKKAAESALVKAVDLLAEDARRIGMDLSTLRDLAMHAAAAALDRRGYIRYAHAFTGGSRVNVARFGERRLNAIIAELVEWMTGQNF